MKYLNHYGGIAAMLICVGLAMMFSPAAAAPFDVGKQLTLNEFNFENTQVDHDSITADDSGNFFNAMLPAAGDEPVPVGDPEPDSKFLVSLGADSCITTGIDSEGLVIADIV